VAASDLEANEVSLAGFGVDCDQHSADVVEIDRDELDLCAVADVEHVSTRARDFVPEAIGRDPRDVVRNLLDQALLELTLSIGFRSRRYGR
jgi:hypothetical protein